MTEQQEFLRKIIGLLDDQGIPYMLAGSLGSSFHGWPRATHDVDIVVAPTESQLRGLLERIGPEYYVSPEAAWDAFRRQVAFNVIDAQTGWKADLRVRQTRSFSDTEFHRRQRASILGMDVWVVSPEDVILSKLEWARQGASEQQVQDALGVVLVQYNHLDREYLDKWAEVLGVQDTLAELLQRAGDRAGSE